MSVRVAAGAAASTAPVVWNLLGFDFTALPLVVALCACLMTRLIVSLNSKGRPRWVLDLTVTALCLLVTALWVQAHHLTPLPAGISGMGVGAIGIGIITIAKGQIGAAFRAAIQTFFRAAGGPPPER